MKTIKGLITTDTPKADYNTSLKLLNDLDVIIEKKHEKNLVLSQFCASKTTK